MLLAFLTCILISKEQHWEREKRREEGWVKEKAGASFGNKHTTG